jgi:adenylyltransferase/sulfurtransferase
MYERQTLFLGREAQDKLFRAKVVLIGCGALGSNIGIGLARAGIGSITVVDRDVVEEENLGTHQYSSQEIGLPKAIALKQKILEINKSVKVEAFIEDVNKTNIEEVVRDKNVVLDGTDNMKTRFLLNDACLKNGVPWIYGSCIKSEGAAAVFHPEGPCFRCVFPKPPNKVETCDTVGVISTLPPIIASMEVCEAIKVLTGGKPSKEIVFYDCIKQSLEKVALKKNSKCKACSKRNFEFLNSKLKETAVLCGRNVIQVLPPRPLRIEELMHRLQDSNVEILGGNLYMMSFRVKGYTITVFEDGRALIRGTSDEKVAKSLYSRYIGS